MLVAFIVTHLCYFMEDFRRYDGSVRRQLDTFCILRHQESLFLLTAVCSHAVGSSHGDVKRWMDMRGTP